MNALLLAIIGGVAFRIRGSALWDKWTHTGTMGGRGFWALSMGLPVAAMSHSWLALLLVPALFIGSIPGWPDSIDLGQNEGDFWTDLFGQTWRGALFLLPAAPVLWLMDSPVWYLSIFAGAMCGPIYWAAWEVDFKPLYIDDDPVISNGPPLGEMLFGAWVGLILGISI